MSVTKPRAWIFFLSLALGGRWRRPAAFISSWFMREAAGGPYAGAPLPVITTSATRQRGLLCYMYVEAHDIQSRNTLYSLTTTLAN
jgi:hypothetical protein